jgi:hypothetical protein
MVKCVSMFVCLSVLSYCLFFFVVVVVVVLGFVFRLPIEFSVSFISAICSDLLHTSQSIP